MTPFQQKVYEATKRIPRGKVATYTAVAHAAGNPRAVRATGSALKQNPFRVVPCHRVVRADGSPGNYARGGTKTKIELLLKEGVQIFGSKVDPRCIVTSLIIVS